MNQIILTLLRNIGLKEGISATIIRDCMTFNQVVIKVPLVDLVEVGRVVWAMRASRSEHISAHTMITEVLSSTVVKISTHISSKSGQVPIALRRGTMV